jgi:aspartate racemase
MSKTVGVIGGMGPAATLDFCARVLALTPAQVDQDHLRLLVDNNPKVPDRNRAIAGEGPSPAPVLAAMARGLDLAGAELLVMPCNAAHAFVGAVLEASDLPFVDIIKSTVDATRETVPQARTVGVLGSSGCLDAELYQAAFATFGIAVEVPETESRERFMALLYAIKRGETDAAAKAGMIAVAHDLIARGAEAIVAGCTEVPLVLDAGDLPVPLIDSTDALAKATIAAALAE